MKEEEIVEACLSISEREDDDIALTLVAANGSGKQEHFERS